ncbi:hypothetical protein ACWNMU_19310, partial [Escherichia fergusonii]
MWCEITHLWHRVKTNLTVRSVPGAAIAKPILYCAGQLVFKESGH